jgi:sugar/nucleoside kinase (ribokinase family)
MLAVTDVVSPSLDDLTSALGLDPAFSPELVDDLLDRLLGGGSAIVAISAGENGLFLATAGADRLGRAGRALSAAASTWADLRVHVPSSWQGEPVTTNGAGDASSPGLVFGLAVGAGPQTCAACSAVVLRGRAPVPEAVRAVDADLRSAFAETLDHVHVHLNDHH